MKKHVLPLSIISVVMVAAVIFLYVKLILPLEVIDAYGIMCICVVAALIAMVYGLYYLAFIRKSAIEKCYLLAGLVFGVIFMFIIPPYVTPDEPNHIWSTYYVSNKMLGYGEPTDPAATMVVRACEAGAPLRHMVGRDDYNYILEHIFTTEGKGGGELVDSYSAYSTPHSLYVIPAIGVSIGRLFSWGVVPTLLVGTLCNTLFFVFSAYYAIKKVPFGKMIMVAYCLLPMSLQQANSFSYDNALLASSVVVVALALKWCFSKSEITTKEFIVYMIYSALLIMGKGGVYSTLCFLPILYGFSKEKLALLWKNYRKQIVVFLVMFLLIMFTGKLAEAINMFVDITPDTVVEESTEVDTSEEEDDVYYVGWSGEEGYTLSWILQNPILTIQVFINTVLLNWKYYILTLYGNSLGWFQFGLPSYLIWGYIGVALLSTISVKEEEGFFSISDRVWVTLCSLASCGLCALAMMLFWSPKKYGVIIGLQGRYFLPPYLAMLYCLRNRKIALKWNIDKLLLMANVVLSIGAVLYILKYFCP